MQPLSDVRTNLFENSPAALDSLLQGFSIQTGVPSRILNNLETKLSALMAPQPAIERLNKSMPDIGELALENGFYDLAIKLQVKNKIELGRAHLLLGQHEKIQLWANTATNFELQVIRIIENRLHGQPGKAKKIYQEIVATVAKENLENQAHFYLQAGTLFFTLSDYELALKNYQLAYEKYEQIQLRGKMLVCCYNISITFYNLNIRSSSNLWLAQCASQLRNYHLENLQNSLVTFQLEKLNSECNFEASLNLAKETLKKENLNPVQEILIYQTAARSQIELGFLYGAEMDLLKSRMLMHQRQIYQYEAQQVALEKDLEVLSGQRLKAFEKSRNHSNQDLRFLAALKIAQCREALLREDPVAAERLFIEVSRTPAHIEVHQLNQDLKFHFEKNLSMDRPSPRLFEAILFESLRNPRWVSYLNNISEPMNGPWASCILLYLSSARLAKNNPRESLLRLEHGHRTAEENGFARWRIYFDYALSQLQKSEMHVHKLRSNFERQELQHAAQLFKVYFALPQVSLRTIKTKNSCEVTIVSAQEMKNQKDLVIETMTEKVYVHGEEIESLKNSILYRILLQIASSENGLSKQEIVEQVWEYEYNPEIHDSLVFNSLRRLRDLVPVELTQGLYRISSHIEWAILSEGLKTQNEPQDFRDRQKEIIQLIESQSEPMARRDLVKALQISERTALRELTKLVELGALQKSGQGRAVSYHVKKERESKI